MRNSVKILESDYFYGDRSIDIILVKSLSSFDTKKIVYIYNYNCYHYRLFTHSTYMIYFFMTWDSIYSLDFYSLEDACVYLENLNI